MGHSINRFKQTDVVRALKAATAAGLAVWRHQGQYQDQRNHCAGEGRRAERPPFVGARRDQAVSQPLGHWAPRHGWRWSLRSKPRPAARSVVRPPRSTSRRPHQDRALPPKPRCRCQDHAGPAGAIDAMPKKRLTFIVSERGKPYRPTDWPNFSPVGDRGRPAYSLPAARLEEGGYAPRLQRRAPGPTNCNTYRVQDAGNDPALHRRGGPREARGCGLRQDHEGVGVIEEQTGTEKYKRGGRDLQTLRKPKHFQGIEIMVSPFQTQMFSCSPNWPKKATGTTAQA